jgi:hypothetical protein
VAFSRRTVSVAIVAAGVLLAAAAGIAKWRDTRAFYQPAELLARFPAEDAIALSLDLATLRTAGLLGASKAPLEAEYKQFVDNSGFDYRRDLDFALASFSASGNYFIARGRFNWAQLRAYTVKQGGSCYQDLCRMQGSTPDRRISFLPLRSDTIALAVSTDDLAATRLTHVGARVTDPLPPGPVWLTIPGAVLRQPGGLPPGLRVVFSGLVQSDRVVFTAGASAAGVEVHMDAACKSESDARILLSQLQNSVSLLKEAAARSQAGTSPLSNVLMGGSFNQTGARVTGTWPLRKDLIDTMTAGL